MPDLQVVLTELHQAFDEVIFGFSQKLLDSLATFGQGEVAVSKVTQDASEVFPAAVDQDPACTGTRGPSSSRLKHHSQLLLNRGCYFHRFNLLTTQKTYPLCR